jgi:hypothetical protein
MINEKEAVRLYVRKAIELYKENKKKQELLEEQNLRKLVRGLILKEVAEDQPKHSSTGINVLEDLLKKIIPTLKIDFKMLTTSQEQRNSFRSHIINAVQNTLSPEIMYALTDKNKNLKEEVELKINNPEDQEKFIDIEDKKEEEELSPEEQFSKGLEDQNLDATGRNMAMETYKKIEKNIADSYSVLGNEEDTKLFYDYLITNLKLYFDKFEEEMGIKPDTEPTTPEYEQQKKREEEQDSGSVEEMPEEDSSI